MENENKNQNSESNPKVQWWKSLLGKKWTFPAIYLVASVLIVTILWTRSDTGNYQLTKDDSLFNEQQEIVQEEPISAEPSLDIDGLEAEYAGEEAVPVIGEEPKIMWPLEITENAEIVRQFYDQAASREDRIQAIYEYQNTIYTSSGIDIIKGGERFDVLAVADGKVVMAEADVLHGNKIKIVHEDGLETVYSSLSSMKVEVGDQVAAGTVIGQAGKSEIKKDLPNHLYFEAYRSGEVVDPTSILPALHDERT
ncbi:M23 family metallopeptidase [Desulfuribacillus alkaliarsenatis]|uniref:M23ase beta-sheet core domain-containing protein n=1 Tax=Desulfuribacillus alkaliarsenatis TaxID=766136 RepID=A0A1E5G1T7_9FIRM|nr:M23 family metallopeptidase [Desulfuribacillus alkaliarsenatis]OEF96792.1 hypothetical protein BHF68_06935 [Desulfuribacillus alkaliarsenatis]